MPSLARTAPTLLLRHLPFGSHITSLQALSYLLLVCLFSISFLVFLNSSVSFVITERLGIHERVGDLVGTLGFADELVALVACPVWGIVSDRLGVRWVCSLGYAIVGISLLVFVQANNVYPQLLLARIAFSIGGAATATMVTAILPSMTGLTSPKESFGHHEALHAPPTMPTAPSLAASVDSESTVTQERYIRSEGRQTNQRYSSDNSGGAAASWQAQKQRQKGSSPPRLAGLVGVLTGCGALVALGLFLPLPTRFSKIDGITQGEAVANSFYVVGSISVVVALLCFVGLNNLKGEEDKGWRRLLGIEYRDPDSYGMPSTTSAAARFLPYYRLILDSIKLGFTDSAIGLGYLGGFVARASSVAISLFIPLSINAYFIGHGFCHGNITDPSPELKKECRAAYLLSSELTGISQLIALLCAPLFGYASDRWPKRNIPLLIASIFGVAGYVLFGLLKSPEVKNVEGRGGSHVVILAVAMIGISQIGAIVCSLGLLGRGILAETEERSLTRPGNTRRRSSTVNTVVPPNIEVDESASLLDNPHGDHVGSDSDESESNRSHLKGSIAGVYSLFGGAAILLLTKLGGKLFDELLPAAPFYIMAIFNAILLVACVGNNVYVGAARFLKRE